jgi:DNA-binding NarL/FixJ family response regulator
MTAILIVDRQPEERARVRDLLATRTEWRVIDIGDPSRVPQLLEAEPIDLIVAEHGLAGSGNGMLGELRGEHVRIPVLVLSDSGPDTVDALMMGAASYVPRSRMARDLVVIVHRLLSLAGCHRRHARLLDGLTATESKFRISGNDLSMIPVLCGYLLDGLEEFGLCTVANRMQIAVAIEEGMTNGIVHGNLEVSSRLREGEAGLYEEEIARRRGSAPYAHRVLTVIGICSRDVATIEIRDEGSGFDPAEVVDPTEPRNIDRPHGRGLYLMRAFADQLRFNESGNAVTLLFRAPAKGAEAADKTDCEDGC